jgi:hypothetical protein
MPLAITASSSFSEEKEPKRLLLVLIHRRCKRPALKEQKFFAPLFFKKAAFSTLPQIPPPQMRLERRRI